MTEPAALYDVAAGACVLRLHVQPGSGRDAVAGVHGDALKGRVRARPHGGEANAAVLAFLAGALEVPKTSLVLLSGERSRAKRVRVPLAAGVLDARLRALLDATPRRRHR